MFCHARSSLLPLFADEPIAPPYALRFVAAAVTPDAPCQPFFATLLRRSPLIIDTPRRHHIITMFFRHATPLPPAGSATQLRLPVTPAAFHHFARVAAPIDTPRQMRQICQRRRSCYAAASLSSAAFRCHLLMFAATDYVLLAEAPFFPISR